MTAQFFVASRPPFDAPPKVALETLGCKLNLADTEILAQDFVRAGFQIARPQDEAAVYVLNTCTVTHVADRKARQRLRAARKRFPQAFVVATGCYPQRAADELTVLPEVDLVAGNTSKPRLVQLVTEAVQTRFQPSITAPLPIVNESDLPPRAAGAPSSTRSFVKIQEGCNDYCSYCIIPKTRGTSRSFSSTEVVATVRQRESAGYKEIVLTGTQLGDYGIEMPGSRRRGPDQRDQASEGNPLEGLLRRILTETSVPRIRLSSIQPQDVTPTLLRLWRDTRLCHHFHLPLQSGSNAILRRMRRRYTAQDYTEAVERVRVLMPDVSITTDVIVGFPGETTEDFEATLRLCEMLQLADMHVFPYSSRPGTLATRLDGPVPDIAKRARTQLLLDLARRSSQAHRARFLGGQRPVLWEERKPVPGVSTNPLWHGLTDNYLRVYADSAQQIKGHILPTHLVEEVPQGGILGEVLQREILQ